MSPNPIIFADDENLNSMGYSNKQQLQNENVKTPGFKLKDENSKSIPGGHKKLSIKQAPIQKKPVARVPLGGKDQNKSFPTLNRSQSSFSGINREQLHQKKHSISKQPKLLKSNSSLGFSTLDDLASANSNVKASDEAFVKENSAPQLQVLPSGILDLRKAAREAKLIRRSDTDSLVKHDPNALFKPTSLLLSTFSKRTEQLNASNILEEVNASGKGCDPVKRTIQPKRQKSPPGNILPSNRALANVPSQVAEKGRSFHIHQDLLECDDDIEIVPEKQEALPYHPDDIAPLNENELLKLTRPNIIASNGQTSNEKFEGLNDLDFNVEPLDIEDPMDISIQMQDNDENDLVDNPQNEVEFGLNVSELNDLLDF